MKMPNFENLFMEIQSGCVLIKFNKKFIFFKKKKKRFSLYEIDF